MRIEKLDNSNVLEPGQLLVVLKCRKLYGNAACLPLATERRKGGSTILPASSRAGSMD